MFFLIFKTLLLIFPNKLSYVLFLQRSGAFDFGKRGGGGENGVKKLSNLEDMVKKMFPN